MRTAPKGQAGSGDWRFGCLMVLLLAFGLIVGPYLWIEFIKLCVWCGQFTWP